MYIPGCLLWYNNMVIGQWESVHIRVEKFGGREEKELKGRGDLKKIMQKSKMTSENESMQQVSSESDNGKVFKIRGI